MAVLTVGGLYERVRGAAAEHLGERAPRTLLAYEMGYDAGLWHHGLDPLVDELAGGLSAWVIDRRWMTDEHDSRRNARTCLNPRTYALLRASDEAAALPVYLDLWSEALAEFRAAGGHAAPVHRSNGEPGGPGTVIEHLQRMRKRPAMFFGSAHVSNLWAFVNGYRWAERDAGCDSAGIAQLAAFQAWVDERYPFGVGGTWAQTFRFLGGAHPEWEHDRFFEHLDMFLTGAMPDTPGPTPVGYS